MEFELTPRQRAVQERARAFRVACGATGVVASSACVAHEIEYTEGISW